MPSKQRFVQTRDQLTCQLIRGFRIVTADNVQDLSIQQSFVQPVTSTESSTVIQTNIRPLEKAINESPGGQPERTTIISASLNTSTPLIAQVYALRWKEMLAYACAGRTYGGIGISRNQQHIMKVEQF